MIKCTLLRTACTRIYICICKHAAYECCLSYAIKLYIRNPLFGRAENLHITDACAFSEGAGVYLEPHATFKQE